VLLLAAGATVAGRSKERPPLSVSALQYLLDRAEYDRFDYYVSRYIEYHPDSAVLRVLQGYRYFLEASNSRSELVHVRPDRTGGIPRRYPEYLLVRLPQKQMYVSESYNETLLRRAFKAMAQALTLEPDRRDIWVGMCQMAAEAGRPDLLRERILWGHERFGCDQEILEIVLEMPLHSGIHRFDSSVPSLLKAVLAIMPDSSVLHAELGRHYLYRGKLDSAARYLDQAARLDSGAVAVQAATYELLALQGRFAEAADIARRRYEITGKDSDNDLARIFALAADSTAMPELPEGPFDPSRCPDSVCLMQRFAEHLKTHVGRHPQFFYDELFCLNFPLVAVAYRLTSDTASQLLHKAGLFYAAALYDSAAYYNLRLLRWGRRRHGLEYSTAFNLAAEYYAAGEYILSYVRFMDLYRYAGGREDVGVRYALAVNCERYGDVGLAASHHRYVVRARRKRYEKFYPLRALSAQALSRITESPSGNRLEEPSWR